MSVSQLFQPNNYTIYAKNTYLDNLTIGDDIDGFVVISPPDATTQNYTFKLPPNPGVEGQVLRTDGTGNLTWVNQDGPGGTSTLQGAYNNSTPALITLEAGKPVKFQFAANNILQINENGLVNVDQLRADGNANLEKFRIDAPTYGTIFNVSTSNVGGTPGVSMKGPLQITSLDSNSTYISITQGVDIHTIQFLKTTGGKFSQITADGQGFSNLNIQADGIVQAQSPLFTVISDEVDPVVKFSVDTATSLTTATGDLWVKKADGTVIFTVGSSNSFTVVDTLSFKDELNVKIGHTVSRINGSESVCVGVYSGENQGFQCVCVGSSTHRTGGNNRNVAIGAYSGSSNQGDGAVALGFGAGYLNQHNNSIIINAQATSVANNYLNSTKNNACFIAPIGAESGNQNILTYDTVTKEVAYATETSAGLTKLNVTDGVAAANKALVVDANRDIGNINNLTVLGTLSFGSFGAGALKTPIRTVYATAGSSGTYTVPAGALYLEVKMVGGGGGGAGSGTLGSGGDGLGGSDSSFYKNTYNITASGGAGGLSTAGPDDGGLGGSGSFAGGASGQIYTGQSGGGDFANGNGIAVVFPGAHGGNSAFYSGGGCRAGFGKAGQSGLANTGGGGQSGGAGDQQYNNTGSGGGAGGCVHAYITTLEADYTYVVGSGGAGGSAGTSGFDGGNGGSGLIEVTAHFQ